jgi:hypothetical protein
MAMSRRLRAAKPPTGENKPVGAETMDGRIEMASRTISAFVVSAMALTIHGAAAAQAQTAPQANAAEAEDGASAGIGEIVVTAQKRSKAPRRRPPPSPR